MLAHIRATTGTPVQQTNCHPFVHDRWLFVHNGAINGFPEYRRELLLAIDPSSSTASPGSTDSETLFYLALTFGLENDPLDAVAQAIGLVEATARRPRRRVPDAGDARHQRRRAAVGDPLFERAQVAHAVRLGRPRTVHGLYPDNPRFSASRTRTGWSCPSRCPTSRAVERLPESTALVIQPGADEQLPFEPRMPALAGSAA